jgi:hypothetical protein
VRRRPRTDQRLFSAARSAPPLTEMVFGPSERVPSFPIAQVAMRGIAELHACMARERVGMAANLRSVQDGCGNCRCLTDRA